MTKARQLVDVKKDDGFAALHLAALNGHLRTAETLIDVVRRSCLVLSFFHKLSAAFYLITSFFQVSVGPVRKIGRILVECTS